MKRIVSAFFVIILVLLPAAGSCAANVMGPETAVGPQKQQQEGGVSGIVFFKTRKLQELKAFYMEQIGCRLWMDQGD